MYAKNNNNSYSDESYSTVITNPNVQTAKNVKLLNFEVGTNNASFSLDSPWKPKLSCIKNYQIQICFDKECLDTSIANRSVDSWTQWTLDITRKDLTPCTEYKLKITPMNKDVIIQPKAFPFTTLSETNSSCPITQLDGKLT